MNKTNDEILSSLSVSVVIPAYNAEEHIRRAIESVLQQSRPADEIIVVDDGSTDKTGAIVRGYGEKIRYIQQENSGAGRARNRGIEASQSEWIAFLDADDEWPIEKLDLQIIHLRRHPDLVWAYGNIYYCWCGENQRFLLRSESEARQVLGEREYFDSYFEAYSAGFCAFTINLMIKKDVLEQMGGFEVGMRRAQDTDLWFRIAYRWPKVGYVNKPLAIYHRLVPASITKTHTESKIIGDLVERHFELSKRFGKFEEFRSCGIRMLQTWMRDLVKEERWEEILELTDRFEELFSRRFNREMRLRAQHPLIAPALISVVGLLKKMRLVSSGHQS
ncbi:MAG: glycosyltransferase family 2 protein [Planctomycetes bacterium]|nr:glycosyltransferase family 2 protein [Planctomycetota bacterium]